MAYSPGAAAPAEVQVRRDILIPLSSGAELAADLYLPAGGGPAPALMTYLPYLKDGMAGASYDHANRFFAARGYACLLVDFRGTGGSSGAARPPFSPEEAADAAEAVEWIAKQEWCDGNVGVWGSSYPAIMSMQTAALRPAGLKAIAPLMGHLDSCEDFVCPGGPPSFLGALGVWGTTTFGMHLLPPLRQDPEGRWFRLWKERLATYEPYLVSLFEHRERDDFWEARAVEGSRIEVPAFCIAGWHDLFCDGQIRAYEQMAGPKKLWVGPWMHVLPHQSPEEPVDCLGQLARWWDHWLRGLDSGILDEPPVTLFVQGQNAWRHEQAWPSPDAKAVTVFLAQQCELLDDPPEPSEAGRVTDPTVGVTAGLLGTPASVAGRPLEQAADEARSLVYTGRPLHEAVLISGAPVANLAVAVDQPEVNLVVKLSCVAPDGASTLITRGSVRHHPDGADWSEVVVRLWPTCYEVPAGHRLRIAVAGADFPNLWPTSTNPEVRVASGGGAPSRLHLPTVTGRGVEGPEVGPPGKEAEPPHVLDAAPMWEVSTDHVAGTTSVASGGRMVALTPDRSGRILNEHRVRGTVAADRPEDARVEGSSHFDVVLPGGSRVTVDARTWITAAGLSLHGRVLLDGQLFFERTWTR